MAIISVEEFLNSNPIKLCKKELNSGEYSVVYSTGDPNKVIKSSKRMTEDGWLYYAFWCLKNPHYSDAALNVHSIIIQKNIYYALIEKCEVTLNDFSYNVENKKKGKYNFPVYKDPFEDPEIKKMLKLFKGNKQFKKFFLDDHNENIMLRKNGTWCIIDPLSETKNNKHLPIEDILKKAKSIKKKLISFNYDV